MTAPLEFGLDTFGDVTKNASGATLAHAQVIRNVVDDSPPTPCGLRRGSLRSLRATTFYAWLAEP